MTTCSHCARPLTHPDSVARGVGPVCSGTRARCTPRAAPAPASEDDPAQLVLWAYQLALPLPTLTTTLTTRSISGGESGVSEPGQSSQTPAK